MIWASVNYHLPNSSFKHLTAGISLSVLNFAWFSIHFWSELRPSLPFFCVLFLPLSPPSCPALLLFRNRWLNFILPLTFIIQFSVLLTMGITSVWQSTMSLSRVSTFLFVAESFLSCRNLHVCTRNVFLSAG